MDVWKVGIYSNDVIKASKVKITKSGSVDSYSIKQSSLHLGSKNTATNENICKTCNKRCLGHVGVIEVINPNNHKNFPIFRPLFSSTPFVKTFLKLSCPICMNVNSVQMSAFLLEADKYYPNLPSSLKQRFAKELPNLMKRRNRCGQPNCTQAFTSFKYNQGMFTYKSNRQDKIVTLDFDWTYKLFSSVCSKSFILLVNETPLDVSDLFFLYGIPIVSTTARHTATFNNNSFELFLPFYKSLADLSEKISHANHSELLNLQIAFAKILHSSIMKPQSTYSVKPSTPSIAVYTLGNDKHSLLNHKLIGGTKYPSGSAVASAKSDGDVIKIQMSKALAKGFLVSDVCCIVTREKVKEKLQQGLYRYLIRVKKEKNIIYNLTDQAKIDIQDGDTLLRYIETGDSLLMTRFPTLSRYSRVSFEAEIIDDDQDMTARVPIPVVVMFNLDFDGDKVFFTTVFNTSSKVDLATLLSVNACLLNEMTGAFMLGVVQENQIVLNTILRLTHIPKDLAYQLMGKDIDLLDEDKDFYTGRELASSFIPANITYPGVIENGVIIAKQLTGKQLGANTTSSIFTCISKCVSSLIALQVCQSMNAFGYRIAFYHGQCIRIDHLIPDHQRYLKMKDEHRILYQQYEHILRNKIQEIESRNKITNTKIFYREIEAVIDELEFKTKAILDEYLATFKDNKRDYKFYDDEINYFTEMVNQELKVKKANLSTVYLARGKIKDPTKFLPGVNGKTTIYTSPNQFTFDSIGYSPTCHIEGATINEATLIVSRVATVQFQDIHQKTADIGTINKKQLKLAQHIRTNHNRSMLNGDILITPIANELGALPKDLTKITITAPSKKFINYELCQQYYNEIEDLLQYVDNEKGITTKKECMFYVHPYSFIRMHNDTHEDEEEYNPHLDIISFWKKIRHDFFFMLRPMSDLIYISLLYFDPSKEHLRTFAPDGINLRITKSLWKRFESRVVEILTYSITTSLNGIQCATAIQAVTTQQALSAHQPVSRMGTTINANFVSEYLATLRLKKRSTDILQLHSFDENTIKNIYRRFRYVSLNTLEASIKLEKIENTKKTNDPICRCEIKVLLSMLQSELMNITDFWQMLTYNFGSLSYLYSYSFDFDVDIDYCTAIVDVNFNLQEGSFVKHITQLEIDIKSFNKGRENNFLEIVKLPDNSFKIELEIKTYTDFQMMSTQNIYYAKIPLNMTRILGNLKLHSTIRNELVSLTDPNLLFAYQTLADSQYSTKVIKPLKLRPENNKIFTASTFDTPLNLAESALKNHIDTGLSIESSSFKGAASGIGKPLYDIRLDPYSFNQLEVKTLINDLATEVPLEIF